MMATITNEITAGRDSVRERPKGYKPWRPIGRTQALMACVTEILEQYRDYLPLTCRQIFYALVGGYDYPKEERFYKNTVCEALVRARRARVIPFDHIRDDGIVTYSPEWHRNVESFWNDTAERMRGYQRDRQEGQSHRLELWCEAAGMAPQLARVAGEFSVPVFSASGFSSLPAVRLVVDRAVARNHPTVLLHVGDFDPSGEAIFEAMTEDVMLFFEEDRILANQEIIPQRVALTAEQVALYNLPTSEAKRSDSRSAKWEGETCQLEALPPDELAQLVREAILGWIDLSRLRRQVESERGDRDQLLRALPRGAA